MKLAVFGHPVVHSLSPRIHGHFARQAGMDIDYEAVDTPAGTLAERLQAFLKAGGSGCNVTLPLKQEAAQLARIKSDPVVVAGSANTLISIPNGWSAHTTDGIGLVSDLLRLGLDPRGKTIALLGAGGAALGITGALLDAQPQKLLVFNRTPEKAESLARQHESLGPVAGFGLEALDGRGPFDLIIHATALGHSQDQPPLSSPLFAPGAALYDLNYGPAAQPLAQWCARRGISHHDGLGMLVGQAAESFRLWTDFEAQVAPVLQALRGEAR